MIKLYIIFLMSHEIKRFKFRSRSILNITFFRNVDTVSENRRRFIYSPQRNTHRAEKTIKRGLILSFAWRHMFGQRAKRQEGEREK